MRWSLCLSAAAVVAIRTRPTYLLILRIRSFLVSLCEVRRVKRSRLSLSVSIYLFESLSSYSTYLPTLYKALF